MALYAYFVGCRVGCCVALGSEMVEIGWVSALMSGGSLRSVMHILFSIVCMLSVGSLRIMGGSCLFPWMVVLLICSLFWLCGVYGSFAISPASRFIVSL